MSIFMSNVNTSVITDLVNGLQSGLYSDVTFIVGHDKQRITAHRTILMLRSQIFAGRFNHLWNNGNADKTEIELPGESPNVFKAFLKCVYTDTIDKSLTWDLLVNVLNLGHKFDIPSVVSIVSEALVGAMTKENCINILESTRLLKLTNTSVRNHALKTITENIAALLQEESFKKSGLNQYWCWETWKDILETDEIMDIEEINLFQALLRWADADEKRMEHLNSLLSFIRFPRMGVEVFGRDVVGTGVLSKEDVIDIFVHFSDPKGLSYNGAMKYNMKSRGKSIAKTSEELTNLLKTSSPGDVIHLVDAEYFGRFTLENNFITIQGIVGKTIMSGMNGILTVSGNNCQVSGIKFVMFAFGDKTSAASLSAIKLKPGNISISSPPSTQPINTSGSIVLSSSNQPTSTGSIVNLPSTQPAHKLPTCVQVPVPNFKLPFSPSTQPTNTLEAIVKPSSTQPANTLNINDPTNKLQFANSFGSPTPQWPLFSSGSVIISGSKNKIDECSIMHGLVVEVAGNDNTISNIKSFQSQNNIVASMLTFISGKGHLVEKLSGPDFQLNVRNETRNCIIKNCSLTKVDIGGSDHQLDNISADIAIKNEKGHILQGCKFGPDGALNDLDV